MTPELLLKEIVKKFLWTGQSSKKRGLCELGLPFSLTLTIWYSLLQGSKSYLYDDLSLIQFFSPNFTPELQTGMIQLSTYHLHLENTQTPQSTFQTTSLSIFPICTGHFLLACPDALSILPLHCSVSCNSDIYLLIAFPDSPFFSYAGQNP